MIPALIVVRPFAAHGPGDVIADPNEMGRVLGDERVANVVRASVPDATTVAGKASVAAPSAAKAADQPTKEG